MIRELQDNYTCELLFQFFFFLMVIRNEAEFFRAIDVYLWMFHEARVSVKRVVRLPREDTINDAVKREQSRAGP